MPELPEVETIKRELLKAVKGQTISAIDILWGKTVAPTSPEEFKKVIAGKKILDISRRAKMLVFRLNQNKSLVIHLKLTGQLIFVPRSDKTVSRNCPSASTSSTKKTETAKQHTRLIFYFKKGGVLYFNDLRKFGWIKILNEKLEKHLETRIGIEPLEKGFTLTVFETLLKRFPNRTVKQILLNQELIAGIGNIYADESAFLSKILPTRRIKTLAPKEIGQLHKSIKKVLTLAINKKGTSARDYLRSNGEEGGFVPYLKVYGRQNLPCKRCRHLIKKIRHAGRGTHYCAFCQK